MSKKEWTLDESKLAGIEISGQHQTNTAEEDRLLLDTLALNDTHSIVDLGCGTGQLACEAAPRVRQVLAIDISATALEKAAARAKQQNCSNITFARSSFLTWESADAPFDLIITKFGLHHLPDFWKAKALRRIFENLKPGGRLIIRDIVFSCPPDDIDATVETWLNWVGEHTGFNRSEATRLVRDAHFTFGWIMEGLLASTGFRVIRSEYDAAGVYGDYLAIKPKQARAGGFAEEAELAH
jgi:SAM-dependent methyltransferase